MNKKAFGNRIRQARIEQNYTADMLAEKCNINAVFLRQIECGTKLPSLTNLVIICNVLQISPAFLLKDNLSTVENESLEFIIEQLRFLSQKQIDIVLPTIQALLKNID